MADAALPRAETQPRPQADWQGRHLAALIAANIMLALGPWSVRLSDCGPISAGFWRLALPLPLLFGLAIANRQKLTGFPQRTFLAVMFAGFCFGADLASWHIGIGLTRLGNVTLFGNCGSLILMVWGIVALRRLPHRFEVLAMVSALGGAAILLGRSLEIGASTMKGDLLCVLAGLFYAVYVIVLQGARGRFGNWALLAWASTAGLPLLFIAAHLHGEPFWPTRWWPLFALALGSQVIGQGLLVYALRHFSPLMVGVSLLTQPAIAVIVGWFAFGEALTGWDALGMVLVGAALVMARAGEKPA
jgi:drug/metabolite transporter (DMT)-like permease